MKDPRDIIIRPILTEKVTFLREKLGNYYAFEVARDANKPQIKKAIEDLFKVKVEDVKIVNMKGKPRRVRRAPGYTRAYKKAYVKLKKGERIEGLEGV